MKRSTLPLLLMLAMAIPVGLGATASEAHAQGLIQKRKKPSAAAPPARSSSKRRSRSKDDDDEEKEEKKKEEVVEVRENGRVIRRTTTTTTTTTRSDGLRRSPSSGVRRRVSPSGGVYRRSAAPMHRSAPVRRAAAPTVVVVEGNAAPRRAAAPSGTAAPRGYAAPSALSSASRYRTYLQLDMGYSALKGFADGALLNHGLDYGLLLGWGVGMINVEGSLEAENHWYNDGKSANAEGWPNDLSIYSGLIGVKFLLPLSYFEPYFAFGVGPAVYHQNPDLLPESQKNSVDLWDWGVKLRSTLGFQIKIQQVAFGANYSYSWFNFGGETETEEALKMHASAFRGSVTFFF